jgi:hypothetical protein
MSRRIKLSSARRGMVAFLSYSQRIPTIPVARPMKLSALAQARKQLAVRPSWSAIFIRSYALVCQEMAQLRRVWVSWPRPYLYEHSYPVCSVAVEREYQGERLILPSKIDRPADASIQEIDGYLQHFQQADIWSISRYRMALRFGLLPRFLQRLLMWVRLDTSGPRRVKYIGTFGLTNYGKLGAESLHPIGPATSFLTLGPISPDGEVTVKLVYDHRVLDGSDIARALARLDEVLQTTALAELRQGSAKAA